MYFRFFVIISPWKLKPYIWTNLNPLRMHCAKFSWNWPSGSGEDDFSNQSMYFRNFVIISPWKRAELFIFTNLNLLNPKNDFCQVWLKLTQLYWRRRFFKSINVRNFVIISPWERVEPFTWINLNPLYPKNELCQDWLKLIRWFGEEDFLNLSMYFRYFVIISP